MTPLPERRIPAHLRSISAEFSLESWAEGKTFNKAMYIEAINKIRDLLGGVSAGLGDDWDKIVKMLVVITAGDATLEDHIFAGNPTPGIDAVKWLVIQEAAAWRALREYHRAMSSGSGSAS